MKEVEYRFLDGTVSKVMVEDDIANEILQMNKEEKEKEKLIRANEVYIFDLTKEEYIALCERESDKNLEKVEEKEDEI